MPHARQSLHHESARGRRSIRLGFYYFTADAALEEYLFRRGNDYDYDKKGFELAHLPSTSGREKRERRKLSYTSCPEINREISSLVFAGVHRASTSGLPIRFCAKPQRPVPT